MVCDPDSAACGPGTACVRTGCIPSYCFCDSLTGTWACTADCGFWWECLPDCNINGQSDLEEGGGACELTDDCLDTLSECCENLGGTYLGDGTACPVAGDQEALDQNRQLWEAAGILTYRYRFQRVCECLPEDARPVIVNVQNDAVNGATYADSGQAVDADRLARFSTINELFDVIQQSINDVADSIIVEYDSELGYPFDVWIDHDTCPSESAIGAWPEACRTALKMFG